MAGGVREYLHLRKRGGWKSLSHVDWGGGHKFVHSSLKL